MVKKIISGGLTVADQAAFYAAISLGIPHGGYIPWGRMTEIGKLPSKYKLQEMKTDMVGTNKALAIGVKNDKTEKRYTYLRQRLRERRLAIFSEERRINVYQTDRI